MKVIIIGCTHAGTAAAINTRKLYPNAQITVYERNNTVSFLSCGIALYVGGVVKNAEELFYSSPEQLAEIGVSTKMRHEVIDINSEKKTLLIKNLENGQLFADKYDKLIMTTGSWPIQPPIEGITLKNILLSKNYDHSNTIIEKAKNANKITVIGAGYIGVELVEAFCMQGKQVTLVDSAPRILNKYLDELYTNVLEDHLREHGVCLKLGQTVARFAGTNDTVTKVITDQEQIDTDLVLLCIGFKPNTELLKGQVDMMPNGAIIVNKYMQTSDRDIYAAGDNCAVYYNPIKNSAYIPLATNAVRMGTLVARNLVEQTTPYLGTQGTSGIKIYDYNVASTGLTETSALQLGMDVQATSIEDDYRPEFMPTTEKLWLKVVYEKNSRRIVGAQIMSKADLTQSINTLSVCIQNDMTIDQLAFVDFFFQPHYNKPWNYLNKVGIAALQHLSTTKKEQLHV